jgi:hypothetical protein
MAIFQRTPLWAARDQAAELGRRRSNRGTPWRPILARTTGIGRGGLDLVLAHRKTAVMCIAVIAISFWAFKELSMPVAIVDVISVPKSLNDGGFSTSAISTRIIEAISKIDYGVREDSLASKKSKAFRSADEKELAQFEIPGSKLTFKDLARWLRPVFGAEPTTITVDFEAAGSQITANATIQDPRGYLAGNAR